MHIGNEGAIAPSAPEVETRPEDLPVAFTWVGDGLPNECKTVLGIRRCSTRASKFEVMTVRYMPNYRPHNPWQTVDNDSVTDSGREILGWLDLDATDFGADWLNG